MGVHYRSNIANIEGNKTRARKKISHFGIMTVWFLRPGDYSQNCDFDILVDFKGPIDGFEYIPLAHDLQASLQYKIAKRVEPECWVS